MGFMGTHYWDPPPIELLKHHGQYGTERFQLVPAFKMASQKRIYLFWVEWEYNLSYYSYLYIYVYI